MRISLSWLRSLVDLPDDLQKVWDVCDMSGLEVAGVDVLGADWDGIVVGRIVTAEPIEGTKLHKVQVDVGGDTKQALCGAPNVTPDSVGLAVATALEGATITVTDKEGKPVSITVAAREMRGHRSEAVLVSAREIGLSDDHDGAYLMADLTSEVASGTPLADILGDSIVEFELTPDLGRCFSAWGLARELSALLHVPAHGDAIAVADDSGRGEGSVPVGITATERSHRYLGSVIRNVKVGPSPQWMQRRLMAAGMRPINNAVDVANYVMLELGQPLHFFDLDKLQGPSIDVRLAHDGETMAALNGESYELSADDLIIADASGAVAVAGIIGGDDSAVSDGTTNILLEAAHFDAKSIRRTCQRLKLRTDAAERFIKSVDPVTTIRAMWRATALLLETSPGATVEGYQDAWPVEPTTIVRTLTADQVERTLGVALPADTIASLLRGFEFGVEDDGEGTLTVTAPSYRHDVEVAADLIEEVARGYGMNNIAPRTTGVAYYGQPREAEVQAETQQRVAQTLVGLGFYEAVNYSLVSPAANAWGIHFGPSAKREALAIELANPLTADRTEMRHTLVPALLRNAGDNLRYQSGAHLFEQGRAYLATPNAEAPADGSPLPHEEVELIALVATGERRGAYWGSESPGTAFGAALGLFDFKGIVEALLRRLGVRGYAWAPADADSGLVGLTPGQGMALTIEGERAGYVGEVDAPWLDAYDLDGRVAFVAELRLEPLLRAGEQLPTFVRLPTQPAVLRDLAVVTSTQVAAADLLATAVQAGGEILESVELFDRYAGSNIEAGHHSLAMHLVFQDPARTLTADEVDAQFAAITKALASEHGAALR